MGFETDQGQVFINRGYMQGTTECVPGVRVALMAPGDKQWRKCFEHLAYGTVDEVVHKPWTVWNTAAGAAVNAGPTMVRVRMDDTTPRGQVLEVYPDDLTALDA